MRIVLSIITLEITEQEQFPTMITMMKVCMLNDFQPNGANC